jgi:hypothetical protein
VPRKRGGGVNNRLGEDYTFPDIKTLGRRFVMEEATSKKFFG